MASLTLNLQVIQRWRRRLPGLFLLLLLLGAQAPQVLAQQQQDTRRSLGTLTGGFQLDAQYYLPDSIIGAPDVPERFRNNAYLNLNYRLGGFFMGARYEAYLKPLLGFNPNLEGQGVPIRYAGYEHDRFKVTAGHFYDQFGSGMVFRAYWEPGLGFDNAVDGIHVQGSPVDGLRLKGFFGKQRLNFTESAGIVRGADAELDLHELLPSRKSTERQVGKGLRTPASLLGDLRLTLGGSFVSRYQADDDPDLIIPENVAIWGVRTRAQYRRWQLDLEYARKVNDPNASNNFIYRPGQGLNLTLNYSQRGLGVTFSAHRLDNLDFRAERNATGTDLTTNFLPPLARQHTWRLPSLYLYATQPNGEVGVQLDVVYTFQRKTRLGGRYGTTVSLNYSRIHDIPRNATGDPFGYTSDFFSASDNLLYEDFNIEVSKKINKDWRLLASFIHITYNKDDILNLDGFGTFSVNSPILEAQYRFDRKKALRLEYQHMFVDGDQGDWAMLLAEFTLAPHWFFTVMDEWNYDNPDPSRSVHYPSVFCGYNKGGTRVQIGYARQREGIICIGGICRILPASNGVQASVSTTF